MQQEREQEPVTLSEMVPLGQLAADLEGNGELERLDLEARGPRIHRAARFRDRGGYSDAFI